MDAVSSCMSFATSFIRKRFQGAWTTQWWSKYTTKHTKVVNIQRYYDVIGHWRKSIRIWLTALWITKSSSPKFQCPILRIFITMWMEQGRRIWPNVPRPLLHPPSWIVYDKRQWTINLDSIITSAGRKYLTAITEWSRELITWYYHIVTNSSHLRRGNFDGMIHGYTNVSWGFGSTLNVGRMTNEAIAVGVVALIGVSYSFLSGAYISCLFSFVLVFPLYQRHQEDNGLAK